MKKILFYLLALDLFFLQAYLFRFSILSYPSNLQELMLGATFVVYVCVEGPKQLFSSLFRHKILFSVALLSVLSLLWVPLLSTLDALRFVKFVFFAILLAFLFLQVYRTEKERYEGVRLLAYGALAFAGFSLVYNLSGFNVMPDLRLAGPLDSAVYLAVYLVPAVLFFGFEVSQASKSQFFKKLLPFLVSGVLLVATRSFGAVGAALVVLLVFTLKNSSVSFLKSIWFKGLAFVLCLLFAVGTFYVKILPTLQTNYSSLDERGEIWQTTLSLLEEPKSFFLGLGLGQFQAHYEQSVVGVLGGEPLDYYVLQPHNVFLLFMVNYGFLGLILLVYLMSLTAWVLFKKTSNDRAQVFASYLLLYFFIHGLIDTPFFKNDLLFLLFLFLELGVGSFFLKRKSVTEGVGPEKS